MQESATSQAQQVLGLQAPWSPLYDMPPSARPIFPIGRDTIQAAARTIEDDGVDAGPLLEEGGGERGEQLRPVLALQDLGPGVGHLVGLPAGRLDVLQLLIDIRGPSYPLQDLAPGSGDTQLALLWLHGCAVLRQPLKLELCLSSDGHYSLRGLLTVLSRGASCAAKQLPIV